MDGTALMIFAKCPVPGRVNTRLQPQLTEEESARLQEAWILDTIHKAMSLSGVTAFLGYSPSDRADYFQGVEKDTGIRLFSQKGETLGKKIQNAFSEIFSMGYEKMLIIGVDSPTFPPELISDAVDILKKNDAVFGPTVDGGYYLAGMRDRPLSLFPDNDLGTEDALMDALQRGRELGIKIAALPPWYDLDRYSDLNFAHAHIRLLEQAGNYIPPRTKEILERLFSA